MKSLGVFLASLGLMLATIAACDRGGIGSASEPLAVTSQAISAVGSIPAGLPQHVMIGLKENHSGTWMADSGVPWDVRYRYLGKGWIDNWGFGPTDGGWGLQYMTGTDSQGFIPLIQFYLMNDYADGGVSGEQAFLATAQDAVKMNEYFREFKTLMQRAKDFNKPVLILIEGDGFGLLQKQSNSNPDAVAAVASTGMPELAGLPDTVAGWGLAFLQLRKSVGATNVILGIHVTAWAGTYAISYEAPTVQLQPQVDEVYNFLAPLGLTTDNVTGETYDLLYGDPLDRDSDFYRVTDAGERWWNECDSASIYSASFNRYAEWLRLWNLKTNKRWVLWQIPLGNSNHLNVPNDGGMREGYRDNRAEYFFGSGTPHHVAKFAQSGVIGLFFGLGADGQSSYENDLYGDGKLFMQSRVAAFYDGGGVPLDGGYSGAFTDNTCPPDAGTPTDGAQYHFEQDAQGWTSSSTMITGATSSTQAFAGSRSLAVDFSGSGTGVATMKVENPGASAGSTVTFRLWIPAGSTISWVQPFVQQGSATGYAFTGNWQSGTSLIPEAWNTLTVTVPSNAVMPLYQLGIQFNTTAAWTGTVYIDSVSW
jgi:hypothetical protein